MLVVLDSILNRITQNRAKGKNTFIFIDEIYLLFQHEYSANFLFTLWKRVRKYGAYATGITQNVEDLLQSHTARTMLANSEFIVKRMQKDACYSFEDGTTERYNIECCIPDFTEALFRECFPQRLVEKAFSLLTPIQQSRVKQHIFGKKSFAKIAASEGKAKNTIQESYDAAIKKMKKFLKNTLPKETPYSE